MSGKTVMKKKMGRILLLTLLSGMFTICARGEELDGKSLFHEKCAMCHRVMGMGTGLLARRVDEPMLESRTDLTSDYVMMAARQGIGNMPAIPRGEASDEQLDAIADYLTAGNPE